MNLSYVYLTLVLPKSGEGHAALEIHGVKNWVKLQKPDLLQIPTENMLVWGKTTGSFFKPTFPLCSCNGPNQLPTAAAQVSKDSS